MKKRFYVFFCEGELPWYLKWLRKDRSHCFVIEHQLLGGYDHLIKIENLINIVEVITYLAPLDDVLALLEYKEYKMIQIDAEVDPTKPYNPFGLMDCVSLTKKLLGINRPLIFTPNQLYRYLKEI